MLALKKAFQFAEIKNIHNLRSTRTINFHNYLCSKRFSVIGDVVPQCAMFYSSYQKHMSLDDIFSYSKIKFIWRQSNVCMTDSTAAKRTGV